jgi:hypothetical protein
MKENDGPGGPAPAAARLIQQLHSDKANKPPRKKARGFLMILI